MHEKIVTTFLSKKTFIQSIQREVRKTATIKQNAINSHINEHNVMDFSYLCTQTERRRDRQRAQYARMLLCYSENLFSVFAYSSFYLIRIVCRVDLVWRTDTIAHLICIENGFARVFCVCVWMMCECMQVNLYDAVNYIITLRLCTTHELNTATRMATCATIILNFA